MDATWKRLLKSKNKTSAAAVLAREHFTETLDQLFDISAKDAEGDVSNDILRSKEAKLEDQKFLINQRGPRKMEIGSKDNNYDKKVKDKLKRDDEERVEKGQENKKKKYLR